VPAVLQRIASFGPVTAIALAWLGFCGSAAAAPLSTKVTDRVVEAAIESGLEALSKPENQRRLGAILSSTAVTGGVHDIAFAVVDGVLDGVHGRVTMPAVDTAAFWKGFDGAVRQHVSPAAEAVTRKAVDAALATALSEENGLRVEAFAAHATHGVIKGLAQGLREDLAPALAYAIEHELAPAGAAAMEKHLMPAAARALSEPAMQVAIATTMSSVARSLVYGGDAGISSARAANIADGKDAGPIPLLGDRLSLGLNIALGAAAAFAAVLILLAVLLARSNRNQHRVADQARRREAEWLAVVERLDQDDSEFDREKLRELLREHSRSE
jgi:hypothetical protein